MKTTVIIAGIIILILLLCTEKSFSDETSIEQWAKTYITSKRTGAFFEKKIEKEYTRFMLETTAPLIIECSKKHGIDPKMAFVISWIESRWYHDIRGKGREIGIFQVKPFWFNRYKKDKNNLYDQINLGVYLIKYSINKCKGSIIRGFSYYRYGKKCSETQSGIRRFRIYKGAI